MISAHDQSASGHEEQGQGNCEVLLEISHPFSCKARESSHPHLSEIHYQALQFFGLCHISLSKTWKTCFKVQKEPLSSTSGSRSSVEEEIFSINVLIV